MVWTEQWTIKIDGTNINDKVNYFTTIPDLDNIFGSVDPVMVSIPNDYPVFIRNQPLDATININIQMTPCTWATFQTRLTALRALLSPGRHAMAAQVRGMATEKSLSIIVTSFAVDPKARRINVQAIVPKPVWV
jgi:hypothetical protein